MMELIKSNTYIYHIAENVDGRKQYWQNQLFRLFGEDFGKWPTNEVATDMNIT